MRLALRDNRDQVEQELDAWARAIQDIARPRILNKLRDQAQVAGLRAINDEYRIGPRTMERFVRLTFADAARLEAELTVRGKGFPLSMFAPRQTRAGVSVQVKGRRFIVPGSFMARMPTGHVGVFARGSYGGRGLLIREARSFGRFIFGRRVRITQPRRKRSELPVNELFTLSPPDAFANPDVTDAMNRRLDEQAAKVVEQEIRFATR
jgi:hypothetical protein